MNATLTITTEIAAAVADVGTLTYGVTRDDTSATVVAVGTPLVKVSTGVHAATFAEPAENVNYTVRVTWAYGGESHCWVYKYLASQNPHAVLRSPKDVLAKYLYDLGWFSDPDAGAAAWPLYRGSMPEVDGNCASIYDTTGVVQGKTHRGRTDEQHGVQLRVRTAVEADGFAKLRTVAAALALLHGTTVEIDSSESWKIENVRQATTIVALGRDLQSHQVRYLHTLNLLVKLKEI